MTDICKVCLKTVKRSDMVVLCDHCDNWIHIKCNNLDKFTIKWLKVQRTRGSEFLSLRIFYHFAIDIEMLKKHLSHLQIFFTIMNFFNKNLNNFTDESGNDDTNTLNVSNKYWDPEYFCNLQSHLKSKSLSIFQPNVCSLSKNFDQLHALLTELGIEFDFIGMTESRISKINFSPTNIALENYAIEQTPTESNAREALLYISRKHSYKIQKDLKLCKPHKSESVFVVVIMLKRINIIAGCIYRHPHNNIGDFNTNYLKLLLQKLSKELSKNIF